MFFIMRIKSRQKDTTCIETVYTIYTMVKISFNSNNNSN